MTIFSVFMILSFQALVQSLIQSGELTVVGQASQRNNANEGVAVLIPRNLELASVSTKLVCFTNLELN